MSYSMLKPNEKAYYTKKINLKRKQYESCRKKFFGLEDGIMKHFKDDKAEN